MVDPARVYHWRNQESISGPVVFWMQRDQRVDDNWALQYAADCAEKLHQPLVVLFCLVPDFPGATPVHYHFMMSGLFCVEKKLKEIGIPFLFFRGQPAIVVPEVLDRLRAGLLVADFNPLRITMQWKEQVAQAIRIPFTEVDAHNILPARFISDKQEYSAFTLRKKITRELERFRIPFDPIRLSKEVEKMNRHWMASDNFREIFDSSLWLSQKDVKVEMVSIESGPPTISDHPILPSLNGSETLTRFIRERLAGYAANRNDPNLDGQSGLSPFLHFGQISARQVAWDVWESEVKSDSREAFLEELIVRRELSDNYCLYNKIYDQFEGFPKWAQRTLDKHRHDQRDYSYNPDQFEKAATHDLLWNAAQVELLSTGKMHGYMRMYWAKKILEWTESPEEALSVAIYLNDRYSLDGRDPNGYAGIAWSIGGVHDRPWQERPVFGMIRYMNASGCQRKFDTRLYIRRFS